MMAGKPIPVEDFYAQFPHQDKYQTEGEDVKPNWWEVQQPAQPQAPQQ
jgi:hypothetical protein